MPASNFAARSFAATDHLPAPTPTASPPRNWVSAPARAERNSAIARSDGEGFALDAHTARNKCRVYVTPSAPADQVGHQLALQLRAAYAHLRRHSNAVFEPFGMTSDQYVLLTVLARQGEATQQALVRHCASDTATMGAMVSLLEAKRLVTRTPHPRDGRARSVQLTPPGRVLAERMRRRSSRLRMSLVGLFDERELRILLECLERLAGAFRPPRRKTAPARSGRRARRIPRTTLRAVPATARPT